MRWIEWIAKFLLAFSVTFLFTVLIFFTFWG